jgi:hypothetical protein
MVAVACAVADGAEGGVEVDASAAAKSRTMTKANALDRQW